MRGVRFYFRTVGRGEDISTTAIIFKLSTGIALLGYYIIFSKSILNYLFKFIY